MGKGQDLHFDWFLEKAGNEYSKTKIKEIKEYHRQVFKEGKIIQGDEIFIITLNGQKIHFKKNSSYSSIDIYAEIFKYNNHFKENSFDGKNTQNIIDIGANEGYYTLRIKKNNPNCKVIAIEPVPQTFEMLKKNIEINNIKNVICINKAVYSDINSLTLETVDQIPAIAGPKIDRPYVARNRINSINPEIITLPQLFKEYNIKYCDILKVDVEGCEIEIFKSSISVLPLIGKVIVEYHSSEIKNWLIHYFMENNFNLLLEDPGRGNMGDLYFVK